MAYFDNASTTFPKMKKFYSETMKIYSEIGINFSRENNEVSQRMLNLKEDLKNNIREIFCLKRDSEIIFNASATFSLNEIIQGLNYDNIKNIYISPFEHNSVYRVLKKIEKEKDININIIKFNKFELDLADLNLKFLSKKPDLVILTHASNVFGNILPVEKIFELAKQYQAITILDTAQTGGVLDFSNIINYTDYLVFSGHKNLYGPSGIGGFIINDKKISLTPLLYGGTGIKSEDIDMPEELPERFEAGSPNTLGIIGLKLATDELLEIGIENIYNKKKENLNRLYKILMEFDEDITIHSNLDNNIGIISITSKYHSPQELELYLREYDISIRRGLHCAPIAHRHLNTSKEGTIRLSVGYFNKEEEFKILEEALQEIL